MSDALIRAAFESRLATWAAAQTPAIPVAFENVAFTPPAGRYLRAFILPATTISLTLDRLHRQRKGVFQVSIVMPIGTGPGAAQTIAAALDTLFPLTTPMVQGSQRIHLITPMSAGPAIQESDRYTVPVSAQYQADTI